MTRLELGQIAGGAALAGSFVGAVLGAMPWAQRRGRFLRASVAGASAYLGWNLLVRAVHAGSLGGMTGLEWVDLGSGACAFVTAQAVLRPGARDEPARKVRAAAMTTAVVITFVDPLLL